MNIRKETFFRPEIVHSSGVSILKIRSIRAIFFDQERGREGEADDPVILQRQLPPTRGLRFLKGGECLGGGRETHNILFFVPLERLLAV